MDNLLSIRRIINNNANNSNNTNNGFDILNDTSITSKPNRMAVLLSGIHYIKDYEHWTKKKITVDFRYYVKNIKTKIYDYFSNKNYNIDTFICTNNSDIQNELLDTYKPVLHSFVNENKHYKLLKVFELLFEYVKFTNTNYDLVLITRFDIYFVSNFIDIAINKLNIISELNKNGNCIDDNFMLLPYSMIYKLYDILKNYIQNFNKNNLDNIINIHLIKKTLDKNFNIHYICNEYVDVKNLSFFKLRYFDTCNFIINKDLFTENIWYSEADNSSQILIKSWNNIQLKKKSKNICNNASFGYEINKIGIYELKFNICSSKDIINFNFIKLNKSNISYNVTDIYYNQLTNISLILDVKDDNEIINFIFNTYTDIIDVEISEINFTLLQKHNNGFIINKNINMNIDNKNNFINSSMIFKYNVNTKIYNIKKFKTDQIIMYQWFGYNILPTQVEMNMSFEIKFISNIPLITDNFCIKTHSPINHNKEWLKDCKKDEFVTITIPLYLKKEEQLVIFIMDNYLNDIEFLIKNIRFTPGNKKYNFVSFYTQGEPYDKCLDLTESYKKYKYEINNYVDNSRFYTANELRNNPDTEFYVKEYNEEPSNNIRTNLIGYMRYKPYIVLEELKKANDGDIIFYRDCNINKYPGILVGMEDIIKTINFVLKDSDIYMPTESYPNIKMKQHVKREVIESIGEYTNNYLEEYLVNASIVICRKSNYSIDIISKWVENCNDKKLLDPNSYITQHPDYKWNTIDQSIINPIIKKYAINFPKYSMYNREFTIYKLKKIPKIAILLAGQMRNFNKFELLKMNKEYLFDTYNCDVFISTWDEKGYSPAHMTINNKDYSNDKINIDDIKEIYNNIKNINIENFKDWKTNLPIEYQNIYNGGLHQCGKVSECSVFPQLYKIWDANRMKTQYENENRFKYDLVIRYRPDMCLVERIPEEHMHDFYNINSNSDNKIWSLNPPKIFVPIRIYDIFFYGNSKSMDNICNAWLNILDLINHNFNNNQPKVDACRVLYVAALINNIQVIDIKRCIGDIYRDENMNDYINKILHQFN